MSIYKREEGGRHDFYFNMKANKILYAPLCPQIIHRKQNTEIGYKISGGTEFPWLYIRTFHKPATACAGDVSR